MNKEKILLALNNQSELINTHVNRLKKNQHQLHLLDIELLRQKVVEIYDSIFELEMLVKADDGTTSNAPVVADVEETVDTKVLEKELQNNYDDVTEEPATDNTPDIEKTESDIVLPNIEDVALTEDITSSDIPHNDDAGTIEIEQNAKPDEPVVTDEEEKQSPVMAPPHQTTYDLFSGNADNVLAEKYNATDEQSIADKMQKTHVQNIREAIGINDKFLLINELFNGDMGRYNKILDDINSLTTKSGVTTYLTELKIQFRWEDDSTAFVKLKELLDRKFG